MCQCANLGPVVPTHTPGEGRWKSLLMLTQPSLMTPDVAAANVSRGPNGLLERAVIPTVGGDIVITAANHNDGITWFEDIAVSDSASGDTLSLMSGLSRHNQAFGLTATAPGFSYGFTIAAGTVTGSVDGQQLSGTFDSLTHNCTANIQLDHWLPADLVQRFGPASPLLQEENARLATKARAAIVTAARDNRVEAGNIHNDMWQNVIGRGAAWGFAAMGGAAVCLATGGLGCVLGAFAFGMGGSIAADQWGP
jgi:hypothetical protein